MSTIKDIKAIEVIDSRGLPTIKTTVLLSDGTFSSAAVPSGASTGSYEAYELRDNDPKRLMGKGVKKAVANVNDKIKKSILGKNIFNQQEIDQAMVDLDGSSNKQNLGANAILSVSLSCARVAAKSSQRELFTYLRELFSYKTSNKITVPMFNVLNGGKHGSGMFNFQEFLIMPEKTEDITKSILMGVEFYQNLKQLLKKKGLNYSVGDEGGFTPNIQTNIQALDLIKEAIDNSRFVLGKDIFLGLDLAANEFVKNYKFQIIKQGKLLTSQEYVNTLLEIQKKFKIYTFEDPFPENAWEDWSQFTARVGNDSIIIGDDLIVTNIKRLKQAINQKACNAVLVKLNQIGTLTETLEVIKMAYKNKFKVVISHRSGETNDDFIADLAIAVKANFVKFGAPARGERVAKYNRLLQISLHNKYFEA